MEFVFLGLLLGNFIVDEFRLMFVSSSKN